MKHDTDNSIIYAWLRSTPEAKQEFVEWIVKTNNSFASWVTIIHKLKSTKGGICEPKSLDKTDTED